MKVASKQLRRIVAKSINEARVSDSSDALVNAVLDMQENLGNEYTAKVLRELADDIELEENQENRKN